MTKDKQYHFYNLSFVGYAQGNLVNTNSIMFSGTNKVTNDMIKAGESLADMDATPVLISCSYLGYMTEAEFNGEGMDS
jgi:hypothetical protein